jgi:ABC-type transport system involved in multi-copper enzyme maturation permease subunit
MIAAKTWREIRVITLVYTLILELELVLDVLFWPSLRNEAALSIAQVMPADFLKRMMIEIADPDAGYRAYMATQMFFKGTNIVGLSAALLFGTGLIARERENLTLEFLLARPVSRSRILAAKFAVSSVALVVPILLTSWTAVPLSWLVDERLSLANVTVGACYAALFCLAFLCLTCVFSVRGRTQLHVAFAVGAIILVEVGIYFIQEARAISVFRLSDFDLYGPIMAGNVRVDALLWSHAAWLLLACGACYGLADRMLRRAEL